MPTLDDKYDPEDLQYLTPAERIRALGLQIDEPVEDVSVNDFEEDETTYSPKGRRIGFNYVEPPPPPLGEIREIQPLSRHVRGPSIAQAPMPGWIQVRLNDVARSRGVVNTQGPYRGLPSITAIQRGTQITHSTIQVLMNSPEKLAMLHFGTLARLCDFLECQPGDILIYRRGMTRPSEARGMHPEGGSRHD